MVYFKEHPLLLQHHSTFSSPFLPTRCHIFSAPMRMTYSPIINTSGLLVVGRRGCLAWAGLPIWWFLLFYPSPHVNACPLLILRQRDLTTLYPSPLLFYVGQLSPTATGDFGTLFIHSQLHKQPSWDIPTAHLVLCCDLNFIDFYFLSTSVPYFLGIPLSPLDF